MQANKDRKFSFYQKKWPILKMPGWEPTGGEGYGLIWWDMPVEIEDERATARLCFIVNPSSTRIDLEIRASSSTKASVYSHPIADGSYKERHLAMAIMENLPHVLREALDRLDGMHSL